MPNKLIIFIVLIAIQSHLISQNSIISKETTEIFDKCNYNITDIENLQKPLGDGWGYNYDSLMIDLDKWRVSPFVKIDSIGASVQNRALWQLTISDSPRPPDIKYRITIHARTHPGEVYSFYATRAIINILIGDSDLAVRIRNNTLFNIIPIHNPDGVELGYPRENANGVDLERDWDSASPQPESAALKALYLSYMDSDLPINIALNMHNASSNFIRYFVYHHQNGTSLDYTIIEQEFISGVHSYWPSGIADWDAFISWTQGTPTYYPESWFWLNYGESVIALTFEETTTGSGNDFNRTAEALLNGIVDYLGFNELKIVGDSKSMIQNDLTVLPAYPNPFNPSTTITYGIDTDSKITVQIYDITGQLISTLINTEQTQGWHSVVWNGTTNQGTQAPAGIYLSKITAGNEVKTNKLMLLK
jgi:hypothetical protein